MLKLRLNRQVDKSLQKLPAKHARQIALRILALRQDHELIPSLELKGFAPFRRVKSGEYRIIYKVEEKSLFVVLVAKRNDDEVYKRIKRYFGKTRKSK